MQNKAIKLNLGSGTKRYPDFLNVDYSQECQPDLIWDLEETPWPFETDSVVHILMSHCLEHIGQTPKAFLRIMKELHRVCKNGATIEIVVPHPYHDNFASDPTHVRPITAATLELFDRQKNEEWRNQGFNTSLLAIHCDVDFEIIQIQEKLDPVFVSGFSDLQNIFPQYSDFFKKYGRNIIIETYFQLSVRKNNIASFDQTHISSTNSKIENDFTNSEVEELQQHIKNENYECALKLSKQLIERKNPDSVIFKSHGALLAQKGQVSKAIYYFEVASGLNPDDAEIYCNLGVLYNSIKNYSKAKEYLKKAININPSYPEAYNALGISFKNLSLIAQALESFSKAIALSGTYPEAYHNRGNTLFLTAKYDEALADYDEALSIKPTYAEAFCGKANVLCKLQDFNAALHNYNAALCLKDNYSEALNNRAITYFHMQKPDLSIADLNNAISINPKYSEAFLNRGSAKCAMGLFESACEDYDRSKEFGWPDAEVQYHKSLIYLLTGDLDKGFANYEFRRHKREPIGFRKYHKPLLAPVDPIHERTIFVYSEQGLGDTIQFCRYIRILESSGAKVIFEPQPVLSELMSSLGCAAKIVSPSKVDYNFDFHIPLMSLPYVFGTTLETVPRFDKYLEANKDSIDLWRARLGKTGFKIGICWQCSQRIEAVGRSFSVKMLRAIKDIPAVRLLSLQKNFVLDDNNISLGEAGVEILGANIDSTDSAFIDTAGIIMNCDLVITCDTSVAHLAGALGIPVWVVLKKIPHWVWLTDRCDSPWYPNARLFRQESVGNWEKVFQEIREALINEMRN